MYFIIIIIIIIIIDIELVQLDGTTAEIANEGQLKMGYFFFGKLTTSISDGSRIRHSLGRRTLTPLRLPKLEMTNQMTNKIKEIIKH